MQVFKLIYIKQNINNIKCYKEKKIKKKLTWEKLNVCEIFKRLGLVIMDRFWK